MEKSQFWQKWYQAAADAQYRCTNPGAEKWPRYGARGITFEFASVKAMAEYIGRLPGSHDPKRSIDRIDNDDGYRRGNLRWSTALEQRLNQETRYQLWYQKDKKK